ncbi:acetyl-CoA carboxylase biotin carboxylase subunit family protein [Vibrio sp. Y20_XG_PY13]|uniref:ATP-grasp domain-containing protein n=1 Tax=Vibrio sp. Y20_XG_PY13 TaxID=2957761 RepID=UPI0020A2941B|nr:ATP-grasp domain-containing protein [Vibrio sp. Y20_XG_PY13]
MNVIIVESNLAGNGTIALKQAKQLGYRTIFVCKDPAEYNSVELNPILVADEVAVIDTYDITKLLAWVATQADIKAVLAFDDFRVIQAGIMAEYLGLPYHPSVKSLLTVRDKSLFRQNLSGTAYEIPHEIYHSNSPSFNYPIVLKPVDESGSVGVKVCLNPEELYDGIARINNLSKVNGRGFSVTKSVLLEKYISGQEYSAELTFDATIEQWILIGIVKKITTPPPFCVELAHIFPYSLNEPTDIEVKKHICRALTHLGLTNTYVHVEFKISEGQVYLIEINPRPPGGMISDLIESMYGIPPSALMVASHLGLPIPEPTAKSDGVCAVAFITSAEPKSIKSIKVTHPSELIKHATVYNLPRTVDGLRSGEDRLGYIQLKAGSLEEVESVVIELLEGTGVEICE